MAFALGGVRAIEVDGTVYSVPAILRSCYKLTALAYSLVLRSEGTPGNYLVLLWPRKTVAHSEEILGELCAELADQELRERLAREMQPVRQLIVAQAFAEGNLLNPQADEGDYEDDPLGIADGR